ncbi:MAG: sporulation protein YunB [Clostridia bacterium]|nr:sporulation protein YunB [Clostridia bacterium]
MHTVLSRLTHTERIRLRRGAILLFTLGLLFLLCVSYFNARLAPIVAELAVEKARALAIGAVDQALEETLSSTEELIRPGYDDRGRLSILTCDSAAANRLRTAASKAVNSALSEAEYGTLSVPLGSLLDSPFLVGRGPKISARVLPLSNAVVTLSDSFTSAGINQTLFSLSVNVSVEISVVMPLKSHAATLDFSCPVTQLIIAGDVPQVYLGT